MNDPNRTWRRGFTLVEMLVVIGILTLLITLLLPMIMRSYRQAGRIRAQADLQTIAVAIEAFRQDFGDIPRPDPLNKNNGAAILGKALLGPYGDGRLPDGVTADNSDPPVYVATAEYHAGDAFRESAGLNQPMYVTLVDAPAGTAYSDYSIFAHFDPLDGADGPGYRKRGNSATGWTGPASPAYLNPGKIAFRGTCLLDHYGNPVLYFPGSSRKRDLTVNTGQAGRRIVDQTDGTEPRPTFIVDDNLEALARRTPDGKRIAAEASGDQIIVNRMRMMLGDSDCNGYINGGETAVTQPYLLWTAGPDNIVGPYGLNIPNGPVSPTDVDDYRKAVQNCDDITNFR